MWLDIGKIVGAHGLRGEVRVYPDSDFPERFIEPGQRWIQPPEATEPYAVTLEAGRFLEGKGLYILRFKEVTDRTQAEALRHSHLVVPAADRLPLEEDEFHVADLIGLRVFLQTTQEPVGTVVDVFSAGNDLLAVQLDPPLPPVTTDLASQPVRRVQPAQPVLVPFVHEIVPIVDLVQRRVEINPPPGLLE